MASLTFYVGASGKDWDEVSASTNPTLTWRRALDASSVITFDSKAYAALNTSGLTTGGTITVTSATFSWKHATADTTKAMTVGIWNSGTSSYVTFYAGNGGGSNAIISTSTTRSDVLSCINSSGGVETTIMFQMSYTTANFNRTSKVYSFDSGMTIGPSVTINYTIPTVDVSRRRIFFIG